MGLVCSFTYTQNERFTVPRWFAGRLAVNWADQFVVSCGNPLVLQETVFGGYRAYIEVKSWYWPFSSRSIRIQEMFENFYVIPPGGGTPSAAFTTHVNWQLGAGESIPDIVLNLPGATHRYTFKQFPPAPPTHWHGQWPQDRPDCDTVDL